MAKAYLLGLSLLVLLASIRQSSLPSRSCSSSSDFVYRSVDNRDESQYSVSDSFSDSVSGTATATNTASEDQPSGARTEIELAVIHDPLRSAADSNQFSSTAVNDNPQSIPVPDSRTFNLFLRGSGSSSSVLVRQYENRLVGSSNVDEYERVGRLRGFSFSGQVQDNHPLYVRSPFAREAHEGVFLAATTLGLLLQLGQALILPLLQQQTSQKVETGEKNPVEILRDTFFKEAGSYGTLLYLYFAAKLVLHIIPQLPFFRWRHYLCFFVDEVVAVPLGLASISVMSTMFSHTISVRVGILFGAIWVVHMLLGIFNAIYNAFQ